MIDLITKKPQNLKNDILAGLTVSLALIPEAVAFSFVAHIDPTIGLFASFIIGITTSLFGGRPAMISGAAGAVAVIYAPLVIQQTQLHGMDTALGYLFLAVILMGIIQFLFGIFKLGKFIRLIPHPVMLGFVNGLAIVIFKAQLGQFYFGHGEDNQLLAALPLTVMLLLVALTMLITHYLPRFTKAIPSSLMAIVVVGFLSIFLKKQGLEVYTVIDFVQNMDPTKTTLAAGFPSFNFPNVPFSLATLKLILPFSILAAIVGLLESLLTLTLIDELTETRGRGNKESISQGAGNIISGFFGGTAGCAMIGQSMINVQSGGRGRLSGATTALSILFFILFGSALIEQIPLAALVGVMFMVVIATFEWSSFRILKRIPKADAFVLILVSAITVFVDLAIAVIAGVIVSALVFAWEQGKQIRYTKSTNEKNETVYHLNGGLFFASVTSFKDIFTFQEDTEHVYINFKEASVYDHSGIEAIQNVTDRYRQLDKKIHLLNLSSDCKAVLKKADNIVELSIVEETWHNLADDDLA